MSKAKAFLAAALLIAMLPLGGALAEEAQAPGGAAGGYALDMDAGAFRGVPWDLPTDETARLESGRADGQTVVVAGDGISLYKLAVRELTYRFDGGVMLSRVFRLKSRSKETYESAFYSIVLRYGIPITATAKACMWRDGLLTVRLQRGDSITITYALDRTDDARGLP